MMSKLPALPPLVPQRQDTLTYTFFKHLYHLQGWKFKGEIPNLAKAVLIASPHTSNADGWYGFNFLVAMKLKVHMFAKASLFNTPLRPVLNWLNVIPVQRDRAQGLTQQAIELINSSERMWIGMTPEGTRHNATAFKKGFYYIAQGARVPIVVFGLDYANKTVHCLGKVDVTGDYEADLAKILALYDGNISAKHPDRLAAPLHQHR